MKNLTLINKLKFVFGFYYKRLCVVLVRVTWFRLLIELILYFIILLIVFKFFGNTPPPNADAIFLQEYKELLKLFISEVPQKVDGTCDINKAISFVKENGNFTKNIMTNPNLIDIYVEERLTQITGLNEVEKMASINYLSAIKTEQNMITQKVITFKNYWYTYNFGVNKKLLAAKANNMLNEELPSNINANTSSNSSKVIFLTVSITMVMVIISISIETLLK